MASPQKAPFAPDYVTVNERIDSFKKAYPEGSLQSEILAHGESRVTFRALAYRTPDDPRPGVGHASMAIPGSTPYTRGSELENCETSAWGRALAALGFEVKRGIATQNEIDAKRVDGPREVGSSSVVDTKDGGPVPEGAVAEFYALGKEVPDAHALTTAFLHAHGYTNWRSFLEHGATDAPALRATFLAAKEKSETVPA